MENKEKNEQIESELNMEEKDNKQEAEAELSNTKKDKKKRILPIIIIVLFIIVFLAIIFACGLYLANKQIKKTKNSADIVKLTEAEKEKIINSYGESLEAVIDIHYQEKEEVLSIDDAHKLVHNDNNVKCNEAYINEDRTIYLNDCYIDDVLTKYSYGKKVEKPKISKEDNITIYFNEATKIASLTYFDNSKEIVVNTNGKYYQPELLGKSGYTLPYVTWRDEEHNNHIANYITGKEVLEGVNYSGCTPIKNGDAYTQYAFVNIDNKIGIYNFTNGSVVVNPIYQSFYNSNTMANDYVQMMNQNDYNIINYQTGEIKVTSTTVFRMSGNYIVTGSLNPTTMESKGAVVYDVYFKRVFEDSFDILYDLIDGNYLVGEKDNHILIKDTLDTVINDYGELDNTRYFFGTKYQDGIVFQLQNKETFKCTEYIYSKSNGAEKKSTECAAIAKPILYLYPKKTTNVTVSFEHPEILKTTYPKFKDKWNVKAKSNGDLYDDNGRYYYGLYWDEERIHTVDFSTGFYVDGKNAIEFLEEKLDYIGLNEREANEFITYWLPILENNKKSLVYFELTEERESYNKINIDPKPDTLLRIVIHIKKVDKKTNIKEEYLTHTKRNGFTAVEWGGTTY